jgi:hypothetical protein
MTRLKMNVMICHEFWVSSCLVTGRGYDDGISVSRDAGLLIRGPVEEDRMMHNRQDEPSGIFYRAVI